MKVDKTVEQSGLGSNMKIQAHFNNAVIFIVK